MKESFKYFIPQKSAAVKEYFIYIFSI